MFRLACVFAALAVVAFATSPPGPVGKGPPGAPGTGPEGPETPVTTTKRPEEKEDDDDDSEGPRGPPGGERGEPGSPGSPGAPSSGRRPIEPLPPRPGPPAPSTTKSPVPVKNTYFIVAPSSMRPGRNFELTVMIHDASETVSIAATMRAAQWMRGTRTYSLIDRRNADFTPVNGKAEGKIIMEIPEEIPRNLYSFNLLVEGSGGLTFSHEKSVSLERKTISIFIQTDKSKYKPGSTVRMRVFAIGPNLKPHMDGIDIKIQDKARNIIKLWKNELTESGVVEKQLPLSDEPVMGSWLIEATAMGQTESKTFDVEEYVLPKVEVEVDVDEYASVKATELTGTIRAKYTYGKPMSGSVVVVFKLQNIPWYARGNTTKTIKRNMQLTNGKADFAVSLEDLKKLIIRPYYYSPEQKWEPNLSWQTFVVNATVTDSLTSITYNEDASVNFRQSLYSISSLSVGSNYKRGVPYFATVQVKNINKVPLTQKDLFANGTKVKLRCIVRYQDCYEGLGKYTETESFNVTMKTDGIVRFQVEPLDGCTSFQTEVRFRDVNEYLSTASLFKSKFNKGSLSLTVKDVTKEIMPGDDIAVNVNIEGETEKYTCCLLSKGSIIECKDRPYTTQTTFVMEATTQMAPTARLVCWFQHNSPDEYEIISDSVNFNVGDMFENQVSVSFSKNQTIPAENLVLEAEAYPGSYLALLAVDQSVLLLGDQHDITKKQVEAEIRQYDSSPMYRYRRFDYYWPMPVGGGDSHTIFQNAGVIVMTDGLIYRYIPDVVWGRRGPSGRDGAPGQMAESARGPAGPGGPSGQQGRAGERGEAGPSGRPGSGPALQEPSRVRSTFPETWIWSDVVTDASGKKTMQVTAPDTITSWVASAFAMHKSKGLGIAGTPAKTTVFKPFFVSLNLPYSVIRNEEFALQANVFNYMEEDMQALVTLEQSSEFSVRLGGPSLGSNNASNQEVQETVLVPAGQPVSVYFWIVPNTLGRINIEVKAQTRLAADALRRKLLVEPEGVEQEFTDSFFIDTTKSGQGIFSKHVLTNFPANTVEGSERVTVTAVGDILSQSMKGVERLIRMPYGCGEQNMVSFVPNIVALKYLNCTNQEEPELRAKAIHHMESGYQRELTYKHQDGSYSAFGSRDPSGSLWLTAFVLKSFQQADEYIYIDPSVVQRAAQWIIRHQNGTGAFIEPGRVLSSYMQGGSGKGAALTAYTLIALCESNVTIPGLEKELAEAKEKALRYLERIMYNYIDRPYIFAIITYALHVCKSSKADEAFQLFYQMGNQNVDNGVLFWETKKEEVPSNMPYWYRWRRAKASDIELNSYALLIFLDRDMVADSLPIAKWLLAQRNANGGFSSTQDTVLGLQALGELACKLGVGTDNQNIQISLVSSDSIYYFDPITKQNDVILQTAEFPGKVPDFRIHAVGNGIAILQISFEYNVVEDETKPAIELTLDTVTNRDSIIIRICANWTDVEESGMVVIEVQMLSGYAQEESNAALLARLAILGVKRVENKDKNVVFYLDELTNKETCFSLSAVKVEQINDIKDAKVSVYQYYSPDQKTVKMYSLSEKERIKDRCDVCKECCKKKQEGFEKKMDGKKVDKSGENGGVSDGKKAKKVV